MTTINVSASKLHPIAKTAKLNIDKEIERCENKLKDFKNKKDKSSLDDIFCIFGILADLNKEEKIINNIMKMCELLSNEQLDCSYEHFEILLRYQN